MNGRERKLRWKKKEENEKKKKIFDKVLNKPLSYSLGTEQTNGGLINLGEARRVYKFWKNNKVGDAGFRERKGFFKFFRSVVYVNLSFIISQ